MVDNPATPSPSSPRSPKSPSPSPLESSRKVRKERKPEMKPSMKHTLLLLLVLAVFGWLLGETLGAYQRAGKEDFLNELVFGCTKWSKGFTDAKFRAVRTGMPSAAVRTAQGA